MEATLESLRYPTGRFESRPALSSAERAELIDEIAALPPLMRKAVAGLSDEQLDTPYRPEGWTLRQVVHHVPESHMNSYVRFKWTLTEDAPTIKAYEEKAWAETPEARTSEVGMSLDLLDALHVKWVALLRAMTAADWGRELRHPEYEQPLSLEWMLQLYAWHCGHHLGHIHSLRDRMGW